MLKDMNNNWHALSADNIYQKLNTSAGGLTSKEAKKRLEKYGYNALPEKKHDSLFKTVIKQANNFLNYVLIAAVAFSALGDHWIDFWVISTILIINTAISTYHHIKARKVVESLSKNFESTTLALRDGEFRKIPVKELVPGDVISLKDGDKFPADVRFFSTNSVSCDEASLTGESTSVEKSTDLLSEDTQLAYRANMGFSGTMMVTGEAKAVVVATGSRTQIGQIASDLSEIKEGKTLFEKRTERLVKQMVFVTAVTSALILIIGIARQINTQELVLFILAALISGIPEGLPTVLTVVLSIAAHRMSRKRAILKKTSAIESLSSVTTIITDKTGTLTENTMNVGVVGLPDGREIKVSGEGWIPEGDFTHKSKKIVPLKDKDLKTLAELSGFSDQADVVKTKSGYQNTGDPTEASRIVMSRKAGITPEYLSKKYKVLASIPYDQKTKYRQNIVKNLKTEEIYLVVVGGAENVISRSDGKAVSGKSIKINENEKQDILGRVDDYASRAFRMQAVAYAKIPENYWSKIKTKIQDQDKLKKALADTPLNYLGTLAINDPVRKDVPEAVSAAQKAGIRVIMATGDHPDTAKAVGIICGIDKKGLVLTEKDIENLEDHELLKKLEEVRIFARMTPSGKMRIARILQESGEVIAKTGDGTNDAPALKLADVGIAMGEIGTDAAREASDLVILDDNFATIISAIEEGRTVFRNVRQTSLYLLTTNFAEDLLLISALAIGLPLPLLPLQILWLNLVTDGVSGVSLATEKPQKTTLSSPPRKKGEGILGKKNLIFIGIIAFIMMALSLAVFYWGLQKNAEYARTLAFVFLVFCQLFNMINLRSLDLPISEIGFFSNKAINISFIISTGLLLIIMFVPVLRDIFRFAEINIVMISLLFALASTVFLGGELLKKTKVLE